MGCRERRCLERWSCFCISSIFFFSLSNSHGPSVPSLYVHYLFPLSRIRLAFLRKDGVRPLCRKDACARAREREGGRERVCVCVCFCA